VPERQSSFLGNALFWAITQCVVVICYRRFGTRCYLESAFFVCFTAEVRNLIQKSFFTSFLLNMEIQFNVHGSVHGKHILKYVQQDATLHSLFYLETALHVSDGTSTHHQERKQLYLQRLVFVKPLLLPAATAAVSPQVYTIEVLVVRTFSTLLVEEIMLVD